MIALPPSLVGASQVTVAPPEPLCEMLKFVGNPGVLAVTDTAVEAVEASEFPLPLIALTRKR